MKKGGTLEHSSANLNHSQISGNLNANLQAKSNTMRVDNNAHLYVSSLDMQGARITGPVNLNSHINIRDVHIKKGGKLNVASLVLDGGSHGGINEKINVAVSSKITVGRNTEVEIGAVEMSD